jgi:ribosomal protein L37E
VKCRAWYNTTQYSKKAYKNNKLSLNLLTKNTHIQTRGTPAFGKKHQRNHTLCRRCGRTTFHKQKARCASCGYPDSRIRRCNKRNKRKGFFLPFSLIYTQKKVFNHNLIALNFFLHKQYFILQKITTDDGWARKTARRRGIGTGRLRY